MPIMLTLLYTPNLVIDTYPYHNHKTLSFATFDLFSLDIIVTWTLYS